MLTPFWLLWKFWKSRNNLIFNQRVINPQRDAEYVTAEIRDQLTKTAKDGPTPRPCLTRNSLWRPPSHPFLKCNFDAAYDDQSRLTSAGWVIRDQYGVIRYWAMARLGLAMSPLEAECKALMAAVQSVYFLGYTSMVFEGDCEVLMRMMIGEGRDC